jgi:hypothetical protein
MIPSHTSFSHTHTYTHIHEAVVHGYTLSQVFRVSGASTNNPSLMRLTDPMALWQAKAISLCLLA